MNCKSSVTKFLALILAFTLIITASSTSAFAATILSKADREAYTVAASDEIVRIAREQIGFYEDNTNKFTTWYYGYETDAYWCSIFVSWCADQIGAVGTSVPKRSACSSMRNWFEMRGDYYPVDSDYVPKKGDIVFINTEVDGTDAVHHVEIITENGFFGKESNPTIKCIGGNTSDLNFNGSEYVTEKTRPLNGSRAQIVGYAHPKYAKSMGLIGKANAFSEKTKLPFIKLIESKLISLLYSMEVAWKNFTTSVEMSIQQSNENFRKTCADIEASFNSIGKKKNDASNDVSQLDEETPLPTMIETTQPA